MQIRFLRTAMARFRNAADAPTTLSNNWTCGASNVVKLFELLAPVVARWEHGLQHDWYIGGSVDEPHLGNFHGCLYNLKFRHISLRHDWYVGGSVSEPHQRNFHSFLYLSKFRHLPLQHDRYIGVPVKTTVASKLQSMNCACGTSTVCCTF